MTRRGHAPRDPGSGSSRNSRIQTDGSRLASVRPSRAFSTPLLAGSSELKTARLYFCSIREVEPTL
jgi:hypothetical protein